MKTPCKKSTKYFNDTLLIISNPEFVSTSACFKVKSPTARVCVFLSALKINVTDWEGEMMR